MKQGLRLLLDALGPDYRKTAKGWLYRCPAHDDRSPSLNVDESDNGSPLVTCRAGCPSDAVLAAAGLTWAQVLRDDEGASPPRSVPIKTTITYEICNRAGDVIALHVRTDKPDASKGFTWRRPGGLSGLGGVPVVELPLFGAELLDVEDGPVYVTEGEKAALALRTLGVPALGTVTGAGSTPSVESLSVLKGLDVILWPDHDEVGRNHMGRISERLQGVAKSVRVIRWGSEDRDDAADFVTRGGTLGDLERLISEGKDSDGGDDPAPVSPSRPAWKDAPEPLSPVAYHGPLGALVRTLEPETEADPAAVLVQLLAAFGCIVGGGPHVRIGGSRHHANLFVAVIGRTAKARKGVSFGEALRVFRLFEVGELWRSTRVLSGLASGEGIVSAIRDASSDGDDDDVGEVDKRVLFREEELARVLAACARQGSTLNPVLRSAWDSAPLGIATKKRMHCGEPHVAVIAHCTRHELSTMLASVDVHNGLANRFLWTWATRSKMLPHGGTLKDEGLAGVAAEIANAADWALRLGDSEISWRGDTSRVWAVEYSKLSADRPGSIGAILARSEAHVLRLSLVYALADRSRTMNPEHLRAALEVWRYCEESARLIFGDRSGDKTLDRILDVIGRASEPLTQAQVATALGWNHRASEIAARLENLHAAGWLEEHQVKDGRGRPAVGWTRSGVAGKVAA